ncbi:hypothetical protein LTR86_005998 [Recurvomyces mirabilis]|nr:hypothetical protein LTR86_005998 [Recurvomyces mirabilis]
MAETTTSTDVYSDYVFVDSDVGLKEQDLIETHNATENIDENDDVLVGSDSVAADNDSMTAESGSVCSDQVNASDHMDAAQSTTATMLQPKHRRLVRACSAIIECIIVDCIIKFGSVTEWTKTYLPPIFIIIIIFFLHANRAPTATDYVLEACGTLCCIFATVTLLLGWRPDIGGVFDFLFIFIFLSLHTVHRTGCSGVSALSSGVESKKMKMIVKAETRGRSSGPRNGRRDSIIT